jgi:ATPase subunit of ABC transporter with duplicated ATPase domains
VYSNALERFGDLDYFNIESNLLQTLAAYEIDETKARGLFKSLSGGQKRFVELTRIEHAHADLALIDEPTNHMDYIAKAAFIDWFKAAKETVVVISHDRDVLQFVDKIIEIKSGRAYTYNGNYGAYLAQNAQTAATQMHDYDIANRTLENLQKQILQARARKPSWSGTADQKNPFVVMERRLQKQYDEIKESMVKPNFWIDRESADTLHKKVSDNYEKFKAKNISIRKSGQHEQRRELVRIEDLQLGYTEKPLFKPINLQLNPGDRLQLIGRNGAGKTTLVRAIGDAAAGQRSKTWRHGSIFVDKRLRLSIYEQEPGAALLSMPLGQAIEHIYESLDLRVTDEIVMRTMGNYLFNPYEDKETLVANLSGGQKARLQIIRMLANDPNVLILDEPTNHLDLPSIEELEDALNQYHGALLYISHDSYFAKNLGGDSVVLEP